MFFRPLLPARQQRHFSMEAADPFRGRLEIPFLHADNKEIIYE